MGGELSTLGFAGVGGDKVSGRGALAMTDGEGCGRCAGLSRLLGSTPAEGEVSGKGVLDGDDGTIGEGWDFSVVLSLGMAAIPSALSAEVVGLLASGWSDEVTHSRLDSGAC